MVLFAYFFFATSMYQGYYMPFKVPLQNKIELANDFLFVLQIYMNMCYTKFVPDPEDQYEAGKINMVILAV